MSLYIIVLEKNFLANDFYVYHQKGEEKKEMQLFYTKVLSDIRVIPRFLPMTQCSERSECVSVQLCMIPSSHFMKLGLPTVQRLKKNMD